MQGHYGTRSKELNIRGRKRRIVHHIQVQERQDQRVPELLIKQFWYPLVLPLLHLDVMHYPSFPPPYVQLFRPRTIMTLHDAGPWRYAEALTLHGRLYFRTLLARGTRTCTRAITVSKHAKLEIAHFLGERYLSKFSVIPEAARSEFATTCSDAFKQKVRAN